MLVYVSAREKEKELQAPLFSGRNAPILHLPFFPSLPSIITSLFPFLASLSAVSAAGAGAL